MCGEWGGVNRRELGAHMLCMEGHLTHDTRTKLKGKREFGPVTAPNPPPAADPSCTQAVASLCKHLLAPAMTRGKDHEGPSSLLRFPFLPSD